jgi:hypothetical protein
MTTVLGGDAIATGTNTVATGEVTNKVVDHGGVTVASGTAVFAAEGTGPGAQASANSGLVGAAGADLVFEMTVNEHGGSGSTAWAESATRYVAIDVPGWNPPGGPVVHDTVINLPYVSGPPAPVLGSDPLGGSGPPSGNVVHDTVTADAIGPLPLVGIATESTAVAESNHLSAVSAWALAAA